MSDETCKHGVNLKSQCHECDELEALHDRIALLETDIAACHARGLAPAKTYRERAEKAEARVAELGREHATDLVQIEMLETLRCRCREAPSVSAADEAIVDALVASKTPAGRSMPTRQGDIEMIATALGLETGGDVGYILGAIDELRAERQALADISVHAQEHVDAPNGSPDSLKLSLDRFNTRFGDVESAPRASDARCDDLDCDGRHCDAPAPRTDEAPPDEIALLSKACPKNAAAPCRGKSGTPIMCRWCEGPMPLFGPSPCVGARRRSRGAGPSRSSPRLGEERRAVSRRLLPEGAYDFWVEDDRDGERRGPFRSIKEARNKQRAWRRCVVPRCRGCIQVMWKVNERKVLRLLQIEGGL